MALDHSSLRLGLENKLKSGRIFLRSTSLLYKILPTNLGVYKTNLLYFLYITSEVKQYYSIYHTDLRQNVVFHNIMTIFQDKLQSVTIQDDQSIVLI